MLIRTLMAGVVVLASTMVSAQENGFYRIGTGDQLAVSVLEDPSLNATVLVRPDGRIALPLVGTLPVEGRTPEAVAAAIRRGLSEDFIEPPTVTVSLVGFGEGPELPEIFVLGQVGSPGRYEVQLPIDALQMLALAGGPGVFAATDRIQIRRREADGRETVYLFDYETIEAGLIPTGSVPLSDGDVIIVPQRGLFE